MKKMVFLFLFVIIVNGRIQPTMPLSEQIAIVRATAVKIIVRVRFKGLETRSVSHGTYTEEGIVTHDHYVVPFESAASGKVLIYDIDNNLIKIIDYTAVSIRKSCFETIILDVGTLPMMAADTAVYTTNDPVLAIDWIDHVSLVVKANVHKRTFRAIAFKYQVHHGASGGGVYQNGRLIANIWQVNETYSTAALVCS